MQETYKLIKVKKIHSNKSDKDYYFAYVLYENNNNLDLLKVLVQEKQVGPLNNAVNNEKFNFNEYFKLQYNSFTKQYQPIITYGL